MGPEIVTIGENPYVPNLGKHSTNIIINPQRAKFLDEYLYEKLVGVTSLAFRVNSTLLSILKGTESNGRKIYGEHHINPHLKPLHSLQKPTSNSYNIPNQLTNDNHNPNNRLSFLSSLDTSSQIVCQQSLITQQFYESRISSLHRYISYCVMFHSMASESHCPWGHKPWDYTRSQSNLRVATTASPIGAGNKHIEELPREIREKAKAFVTKLRGYVLNF